MHFACTGLLALALAFGPAAALAEEENLTSPQQIGENAARSLLSSLKRSLFTAINEHGVGKAMTFCSEEAIPLTTAVDEKLGSKVLVKRTSSRLRNPKNAPDKLERAALTYFENNPEAPFLLQEENSHTTRYYKPLRINAMCLQCHGNPADFNEEVRKTLKEKYPEDKAINYKDGELRGIVRVTVTQ